MCEELQTTECTQAQLVLRGYLGQNMWTFIIIQQLPDRSKGHGIIKCKKRGTSKLGSWKRHCVA